MKFNIWFVVFGMLIIAVVGAVMTEHLDPKPILTEGLAEAVRQQSAAHAAENVPPPTSSELRDNTLRYQQTGAEALTKEAVELVQQGRPSAAKALYEQRRDVLKAWIERMETSRMNDADKQQVIGALQTELVGVETVIVAKHFIYQ